MSGRDSNEGEKYEWARGQFSGEMNNQMMEELKF